MDSDASHPGLLVDTQQNVIATARRQLDDAQRTSKTTQAEWDLYQEQIRDDNELLSQVDEVITRLRAAVGRQEVSSAAVWYGLSRR